MKFAISKLPRKFLSLALASAMAFPAVATSFCANAATEDNVTLNNTVDCVLNSDTTYVSGTETINVSGFKYKIDLEKCEIRFVNIDNGTLFLDDECVNDGETGQCDVRPYDYLLRTNGTNYLEAIYVQEIPETISFTSNDAQFKVTLRVI